MQCWMRPLGSRQQGRRDEPTSETYGLDVRDPSPCPSCTTGPQLGLGCQQPQISFSVTPGRSHLPTWKGWFNWGLVDTLRCLIKRKYWSLGPDGAWLFPTAKGKIKTLRRSYWSQKNIFFLVDFVFCLNKIFCVTSLVIKKKKGIPCPLLSREPHLLTGWGLTPYSLFMDIWNCDRDGNKMKFSWVLGLSTKRLSRHHLLIFFWFFLEVSYLSPHLS